MTDSVDVDDDAGPDAADDAPGGASPSGPSRSGLPLWAESLVLLTGAVVVAILVKALFVQVFYIPSASMEPGLRTDDKIVVQKVSYWFGRTPSRGDVVVFDDPGSWLGPEESGSGTSGLTGVLSRIGLYPAGGHLVKRVIGVAGDTIVCCDDQGRLEVNGVALDEDEYLPDGGADLPCNGPMISTCDWTAGPVPDGELFVMGDNRDDSADSSARLCRDNETDCTRNPYVGVDDVVGKVLAVAWPLGHARFVGGSDVFDDVPDAG